MKCKTAVLFVLLTLLYFESDACLNYYVIDSSGHRNIHDDYPPSNILMFTKFDIEKLKYLEQQIPSVAEIEKFKYISDYCAILIKLGRQKDAVPILERLLKDKSNEYAINANLAVAYELDGQLEMALATLKKSIEIDPNSHRASEWFHQRILEAAISTKKNNLLPQDIDILKLKNDTSKTTGLQISYQLKERVPLTKSKNELLSKVIEESADYYKANISLEWAVELYAIAIGYTDNPYLINKLWNKIDKGREKLIEFKAQGKQGSVSKYLYKSSWKKQINNRIIEWSNYTPYYYEKQIITEF